MKNKNIGQKILHFPLTKIIIGIIVVLGVFALSSSLLAGIYKSYLLSISDLLSKDVVDLILLIISIIFSVLAYIYLFKFYEKRKITELSAKGIVKNVSVGIVIGVTLQSLTILVIYLKGAYSITSINPILYIIPPFTMALSAGIIEEILFRGIIFRIIEEKLGSYFSLLISSIIFGLLHIFNSNSSVAGIGLVILAGLLLAGAYIYTRNLWFPIAIHFAWNFTLAIFGANVSGMEIPKTLISSKIEGAEWFTGGQFGPEGSIQETIFCLIATIILFILINRQGKIIKPYWTKKATVNKAHIA